MSDSKLVRRKVLADLVEATPAPVGYWILASPLLGFLAWLWLDAFAGLSPIPWLWLDALLAVITLAGVVVLPVGLLAHRLITSFPKLFQNTGWELHPVEPVSEAEQYQVRYVERTRTWQPLDWERLWGRAAQGWVYLEIVLIFVGAVAMIPLFFSATQYGFGR